MDPLLPLRSLSTNVEHSTSVGTHVENGFDDARGFEPGTEDVLVIGNVILSEKAVDVLEVAVRRFSRVMKQHT
jgi:hypothetical protein